MTENKFNNYPDEPEKEILKDSYTVLYSTYNTCSELYEIFIEIGKNKNDKNLNNKQEDLLRAMLVFATSGLDSLIKQLIRDALPRIILKDENEGAKVQFKKYVKRSLSNNQQINKNFITDVLISDTPKKELINKLIRNLTSNSLQSKEELFKVAAYFDIPSNNLFKDSDLLEEIFNVRNQIAHEMDIDYTINEKRNRNREEMINYTKTILEIGNNFLIEVGNKV